MEYLLSIVIPTYNRARTLKRALDAIVTQYDERVEIVVCDDASTDNTREIVEAIQSIPIRYIRNEVNIGMDRNFLQCYKVALGKFVLLMGDDDFLIQQAVAYILDFLEKHSELDWIYLNVAPHEEEYVYPTTELSGKRAEIDKAYISKEDFMRYAQLDITALSNIIRREKVNNIIDCEKYVGCYALQTCLWLEATKDSNNTMGIIGKPCVACRYGADNVAKDPFVFFASYGIGFKYIFCTVAPECGYDRAQMRRIFNRGIAWRSQMLRWNIDSVPGWKKAFWKLGFPIIKGIPSAWFKTIPYALLPRCVAQYIYVHIRPKYQEIKCKALKKESA